MIEEAVSKLINIYHRYHDQRCRYQQGFCTKVKSVATIASLIIIFSAPAGAACQIIDQSKREERGTQFSFIVPCSRESGCV